MVALNMGNHKGAPTTIFRNE